MSEMQERYINGEQAVHTLYSFLAKALLFWTISLAQLLPGFVSIHCLHLPGKKKKKMEGKRLIIQMKTLKYFLKHNKSFTWADKLEKMIFVGPGLPCQNVNENELLARICLYEHRTRGKLNLTLCNAGNQIPSSVPGAWRQTNSTLLDGPTVGSHPALVCVPPVQSRGGCSRQREICLK